MATIFDRVRTELDTLGDRVMDAVESSKLHLERSSLMGLRAKVAYKLGLLTYKRDRGADINPAELEAVYAQMDDIAAKIATIDRKLDELDGETVRVDEKPAPAAEDVGTKTAEG